MSQTFTEDLLPRQDDPDELFSSAKACFDAGEYKRAAELSQKVLEMVPHPLVANLMALSFLRLGKRDYAERMFCAALELDAECVPAIANLANIYREDMRIGMARDLLRRAIEIEPESHQALHNMAVLCSEAGERDDALMWAERAYEADLSHGASQHTLGLAYMHKGMFEAGLPFYEARKDVFLRESSILPLYTGGSGRVVVRQEQGLGDTIMVSRWLPKLREMGAEEVAISAPQPLHNLLKGSGLCEIVDPRADNSRFTHHLWTMDLLSMFGQDWDEVDGSAYLKADPPLVEKWGKVLGPKKKPRIGLCWAGSSRPDNYTAYQIDKRRSLSVSEAYSLMDGIDAEWVNLTREAGLPDCRDFSCQIEDFSDMAGLLGNLDAVVTVDTAMAHLCGGLGLETICMHRYDTCWRWSPYTERTPLYDNMRHYYQPRPFDWRSVIDEVRDELQRIYQ